MKHAPQKPFAPSRSDMLALEAERVARRRWQEGHLFQRRGRWYVRYRVDRVVKAEDGSLKIERALATPIELGPSVGPAKLTQTQAKARRAEVMATVNAGALRPQSLLTVSEFIVERFTPEYVSALKPAGQKHYKSMLKHVVRTFGALALRDVTPSHVRRALADHADTYSRSTLTHIRNVTHTVFNYAEECGFFAGRNPASRVRVPESAKAPKRVEGYSQEQAARILAALESPLREMAVLSISTSMHAAELAGLRVQHLNLSDEVRSIDGQAVPPGCLIVCESVYLNKRSSPKASARRRVLPIPASIRHDLVRMVAGRESWMPVFVMPKTLLMAKRTGSMKPVDPHNVGNRVFRPLSKALGFPVNWHRFRHTHATWTDEIGLETADRVRMMGHTSERTTAIYTHPIERQRKAADAIAALLTVEPTKVQ